jgi:hypothetical protein
MSGAGCLWTSARGLDIALDDLETTLAARVAASQSLPSEKEAAMTEDESPRDGIEVDPRKANPHESDKRG